MREIPSDEERNNLIERLHESDLIVALTNTQDLITDVVDETVSRFRSSNDYAYLIDKYDLLFLFARYRMFRKLQVYAGETMKFRPRGTRGRREKEREREKVVSCRPNCPRLSGNSRIDVSGRGTCVVSQLSPSAV